MRNSKKLLSTVLFQVGSFEQKLDGTGLTPWAVERLDVGRGLGRQAASGMATGSSLGGKKELGLDL